jgi:PAS domain S-box-containing protein
MRPSDPANPGRHPTGLQPDETRALPGGSLPGETVASLILEHVHDAVFATDLDNRITFWGASAEALFGFSADEAMGRAFGELLPFTIGAEQAEADILAAIAAGHTWRGEGSVRLRDGRALWIESTVSPLVVDGQIVGGVSVSRDVTAQRAEADRYRTVVDALAEGVVVQDADGAIVMANPAARAILGWGRRSASSRMRWPAEAMREDGTPLALEDHPAAETLRTGQARRNALLGLRRPSGEVRWIAVHTDPLPTPDGRRGVVSSFEDVTHYRAARTDQLFEDRLRAALSEALGEIPTDSTIEDSAQALCAQIATLPGIDLVGLGAFLADDELVILASQVPPGASMLAGQHLPADGARYLWERAAGGPWAQYTRELVGVGSWSAELVDLAMQAVAVGPIAHGGHLDGVLVIGTRDHEFARRLVERMPAVVAFSATSSALLAERLHGRREDVTRHREIEAIIGRHAFHPVFQPIVDLASREPVGYEALTRFASGQRPDRAFADAWAAGLGPELELATLEAAVAAGKQLPPGRWLDLNVSPRLLLTPDRLRDVLRDAGRPLVLEVTEHEIVADYVALRAAFASLGHDVRLAVDDAGAGVANFGHIIELRPDFVKLDIGLVRRVNANLGRQAMVVGMRQFARSAGCRLIAEGVETELEAATLEHLGVEFGQGYLFGRPGSVEALDEGSPAGAG